MNAPDSGRWATIQIELDIQWRLIAWTWIACNLSVMLRSICCLKNERTHASISKYSHMMTKACITTSMPEHAGQFFRISNRTCK